MLKKIQFVASLSLALSFVSVSLPTQAAPIWGPWSYSHEDIDFNVSSGLVTRCWYVRYKLADPTYRDAYRSFTLARYATECPATPPFTI